MGGATGLIGDPSGKVSERPMLARDEINKNIKGIEKTLKDVIANIYSHVEKEKPELMSGANVKFELFFFFNFISTKEYS